jgi:hypothetical protein
MSNSSKKIDFKKSNLSVICTSEKKLGKVRANLISSFLKKKDFKIIYLTLNRSYAQVVGESKKNSWDNFFFIDFSLVQDDNEMAVKVAKESSLDVEDVFFAIRKIIDYYTVHTFYPPHIIIVYDFFPRKGLDSYMLLKYTQNYLKVNADISSIVLVVEEKMAKRELTKLGSCGDVRIRG